MTSRVVSLLLFGVTEGLLLWGSITKTAFYISVEYRHFPKPFLGTSAVWSEYHFRLGK
jgi:hypothetical protein